MLGALTGQKIGEEWATSLSDALRSNTTLTKLNLCCEHKRTIGYGEKKKHTHLLTQINSTGCDIWDIGAASLASALKVNTTLTELDISGEHKGNNIHRRHPSTIHCFLLLITNQETTLKVWVECEWVKD